MSSRILADLRVASGRSKAARERRDELIVRAAQEHSYREVAEAAGLSKSRVLQIARAGR